MFFKKEKTNRELVIEANDIAYKRISSTDESERARLLKEKQKIVAKIDSNIEKIKKTSLKDYY